MRLDKFLCDCSDLTRSLAGKLIRQGEVMVDGIVVKQPAFHINEQSQVEFDGVTLTLDQRNRYFMLHKPEGYVCSNEDPDHPTVFFLMDEPAMGKLHVVGRLDLDTTGLVLVTDDGQWSHRITSPRHECAKTYHVWLADPVSPDAIALFAEGVLLRSETEKTLRPAGDLGRVRGASDHPRGQVPSGEADVCGHRQQGGGTAPGAGGRPDAG